MKKVKIHTEFIKLDQFLKLANCVDSGGIAKMIIQDSRVAVNGEICTMRGKKLHLGDEIRVCLPPCDPENTEIQKWTVFKIE